MAKGIFYYTRLYSLGLSTMKVIGISLVFMICVVFIGLTGFVVASNGTDSLGGLKIGSYSFQSSFKKSASYMFLKNPNKKIQDATKNVNFPAKAGFYFTGDRLLKYQGVIDTPSLTISAWVKIAEAEDNFFSVIMANRDPGCQVLPKNRGFSIFSNPKDATIHVMWSTPTNACEEISTPSGIILYDHWMHVVVVFTSNDATDSTTDLVQCDVTLYINGIKLASATTSRYLAPSRPLVFGAWNNYKDIYMGRMSTIQVWDDALSELNIVALSRGSFTYSPDYFAEHSIKKFLDLNVKSPSKVDLNNDELETVTLDDKASKVNDNFKEETVRDDDDVDNKIRKEEAKRLRMKKMQEQELQREINQMKKEKERLRKEKEKEKQEEERRKKEEAEIAEKKRIEKEEEEKNAKSTKQDAMPIIQEPKTVLQTDTTGKLRGNKMTLDMFREMLRTYDRIAIANGAFSFEVPDYLSESYAALSKQRAEEVKQATIWNWNNYKEQAWGHDELKPASGGYRDNWGGMGMTLIDALDTLYLMDLKTEFNEAKEWVRSSLNMNKNMYVSTFETNIRVVGGLLAAYDLDGDSIFLEKAKEMADRLAPAFNTPSGYPYANVNIVTGHGRLPSWNGNNAMLAELGSMSLEYRYLSAKTKDPKYAKMVNKIYDTISKQTTWHGLHPLYFNAQTGAPVGGSYSMGASADSYYEYLIKAWIQGGKKEKVLQNMYNEAVEGITSKLLQRSSPSQLLYTAEVGQGGGHIKKEMGHLACFAGGMLALGVYHNVNPKTRERDLANAKGLAYTCYQMYVRSPNGVGPESTLFNMGTETSVNGMAPYYILRPEAVETLYLLNKITGDPIYKEWGYEMWTAVEKRTKTRFGHGHLTDVRNVNAAPDDHEESFWFGETLKYYYLLFNDDNLVDLNKKVFNTECHAFSVIGNNGESV
ncbi:hypothetical protein WA158_005180 [Blastocystis sp. Blastoise]